jgi:multidrug resistance efflux pump
MTAPAPIPIPPAQKWRDLRMALLPPITFLLLVITIVWMWRNYMYPSGVVGEVAAMRAELISPLPGTVTALNVAPLQAVTNGQELAIVAVTEPAALLAEMKAVAADLEVMKARLATDIDRNAQNYQQMRLELLADQVQLTIDRTNLCLAEIEYERAKALFDSQNLISQQAYDLAKSQRDALSVTVSANASLIAEKAKTLAELEKHQIPFDHGTIAAAISAQQEHLKELQKPIVLKAPFDGFVSLINDYPGERVAAGVPILVVSGHRADRVTAWVRQPVFSKPAPGDKVGIRSARSARRDSSGTVIAVGQQLEMISNSALPFIDSRNPIEYGLPFQVSLPPDSGLIPGEKVTLILDRK